MHVCMYKTTLYKLLYIICYIYIYFLCIYISTQDLYIYIYIYLICRYLTELWIWFTS